VTRTGVVPPASSLLPAHRFRNLLGPVQLTAVVFFMVSGGPYGIEPLIRQVGPSVSFLLILLIPIVWSIPAQLMVLELNGMMPRYGGYYQWVKTALGPSWGFFEGWWSWLFGFVDLAIYPVLFVEYLSFLVPEIAGQRQLVCLAVVWLSAAVNLLGILPTGRSSVALGVAVVVPFLVLFGHGWIAVGHPAPVLPGLPDPGFAALGMGLFTVMWNYLGWDNTSPFAEEVRQPARSYLVSFLWALVVIAGMYLLAILTAVRSGISPATLESEGFPALGLLLGGPWLGSAIAVGGMASATGIFLSSLLYVSRLPKVMADDRLLPRSLRRLHQRTEAPQTSILFCTACVSVMVFWDFSDLLIIDVTLYSAALALEFVSLIVLRIRQPDAGRPFRIPLGTTGLFVLSAGPMLCCLAALASLFWTGSTHNGASWFAACALLSGPIMWMAGLRRKAPSAA